MLSHIYLRDFAIINELDLELQSGMTALTGETGAGKSILLDAIGLVLGDRADSGFVRYGADKAEIILTVDIQDSPSAKQWLEENDLIEADDSCFLRRVISANGKSRGWINGVPVNMTQLKQMGENVVDIHGQHEHQSLMKKDMQRQLIDDYANNTALLTSLKKHYQSWKSIQDKLNKLDNENSEYQAQIDLLTFQTQELDALDIQDNEYASLNEEHNKLANADQLLTTTGNAYLQLYDDEQAIYSQLSQVIQNLSQLSHTDESLANINDMVSNAQILIQEAADELRHYQDQLSLDPKRLSWVENRLSDLQNLARKHRIEPDELSAKIIELKSHLDRLTSEEYDLEALEKKLQQASEQYQTTAQKLNQKRNRFAKQLSEKVSKAMQTLGMKGGNFTVEVTYDASRFTTTGSDQIEFLVSANPGQPMKLLTKVASGGELSRISLAIQMITAQKLTLPALIFDEVDSGIGGGTAEVVGQQLRLLGNNRQVLCVTHLPQVAAQAHHHYKVTKLKQKNATTTGMTILNQKERIEEVARMMGGIEITESTLQLASEMVCSHVTE